MAILLALLTAVLYGAADFSGGMATKKARVLEVVGGSHVVGGIGVGIASLVMADRFAWDDMALGAIGGLFGMVGVGVLYRRLAIGPMNVVAPLTGISAAVVPMAWGVIDGDRLNGLGWLGVVLGLVAVVLVSWQPAESTQEGSDPMARVVVESLIAGAGFGMFFVFLDATDEATSPWPVFGARVLTSTLLVGAMIVMARRRPERSAEPMGLATMGLIALAGLLDTGANVSFLYAANVGQLTVVSVLSALYPIATVVLAWLILRERMTRLQGFGFVAAIAATELLVLG